MTLADYSFGAFALLNTARLFGYEVKPNFTVPDETRISQPPKVDFGPQSQSRPAETRPAEPKSTEPRQAEPVD